MIAMKFGGTSVGDGERIGRVADIIGSRAARKPVVVVSAIAGVTDRLLDAARLAAEGDLRSARAIQRELKDLHLEAIDRAVCQPTPRELAQQSVEKHFNGLHLMLKALALLREGGGRAQDAVVSHGELWSATILARALEARGLPGTFVDARDVIVTDDRFGRAVPDRALLAERAHAHIASAIRKRRIPVTQGFVGATVDGVPTTIGRGGSDYTAALLGEALGAEEVEIWTDADGLMTADPRVVPEACTLPEASYEEAAELAYFGAHVLHPATILPVVERGIPVRIKNTLQPDVEGTKITPRAHPTDSTVKSIASKRGVTTINLRAPRMLGAHGFLRAMFDVFDRHHVAVDVVTTSEVSVSVSLENGSAGSELLADLGVLGDVTVARDRTIVCVVGEGLRDAAGVAARIFAALESVTIEMISQGASKINVTFVVQDVHAEDVVRRLHAEFFPPA